MRAHAQALQPLPRAVRRAASAGSSCRPLRLQNPDRPKRTAGMLLLGPHIPKRNCGSLVGLICLLILAGTPNWGSASGVLRNPPLTPVEPFQFRR
eukprot:3067164-Prorocentrum_lima.AAC.1